VIVRYSQLKEVLLYNLPAYYQDAAAKWSSDTLPLGLGIHQRLPPQSMLSDLAYCGIVVSRAGDIYLYPAILVDAPRVRFSAVLCTPESGLRQAFGCRVVQVLHPRPLFSCSDADCIALTSKSASRTALGHQKHSHHAPPTRELALHHREARPPTPRVHITRFQRASPTYPPESPHTQRTPTPNSYSANTASQPPSTDYQW